MRNVKQAQLASLSMVIVLLVSLAACRPRPLPSPSPISSATPLPSLTPTPTRSSDPSNCIQAPSSCGYPDITNTGVPRGTTLQNQVNNFTTSTSGAVFDGLNILGSLTINADNVTVKNSRIRCTFGDCVKILGQHDMLIDSEIGGGKDGNSFTGVGSAVYSGGNKNTNLILRVNVHHSDDGLRTDGGTTVQDSWFHAFSNGLNGSHSDGNQSCQGTNMSFIHNTFGGTNNDPMFLQGGDCGSNDSLALDQVDVERNLFICLHEPNNISSYGISIGRAHNVTVANNRFDRGWQAATVGEFISGSITLWSGNIYDNDGSVVAHP